MAIPEQFYLQLSSSFQVLTIMAVLYSCSLIYKNIVKAHQRPVYNTVNYNDCTLVKNREL